MATTIIAEPYRHNAVLYFQDNYGSFYDSLSPDVTYVDFYTWLEKEWGCTIPPIINEVEHLVFDDEKKASLFILRFS